MARAVESDVHFGELIDSALDKLEGKLQERDGWSRDLARELDEFGRREPA